MFTSKDKTQFGLITQILKYDNFYYIKVRILQKKQTFSDDDSMNKYLDLYYL